MKELKQTKSYQNVTPCGFQTKGEMCNLGVIDNKYDKIITATILWPCSMNFWKQQTNNCFVSYRYQFCSFEMICLLVLSHWGIYPPFSDRLRNSISIALPLLPHISSPSQSGTGKSQQHLIAKLLSAHLSGYQPYTGLLNLPEILDLERKKFFVLKFENNEKNRIIVTSQGAHLRRKMALARRHFFFFF